MCDNACMPKPMGVLDFLQQLSNAIWFTGCDISYAVSPTHGKETITFMTPYGAGRSWYVNGHYTAIQLVYVASNLMHLWTETDFERGHKLGLTNYDTKTIIQAFYGMTGSRQAEIRSMFMRNLMRHGR